MEQETESVGFTLADAVREFMDRHGIAYTATFVPFSLSRNAKPLRECKTHEFTINWRVTFTRGGRAFSTDYSQGIGYLPGYCGQYNARETSDYRADVIGFVEKGRGPKKLGQIFSTAVVVPPTARDVLESLALDAGAEDFCTYEEWASEYGYDEDSRKGERIYNECLKLARDMRYTFGPTAMHELRAIGWNV